MIIPAIFIEGVDTVNALECSIKCLRESVSTFCSISKDDLDCLARKPIGRRAEASMEITFQMNTLTEKWALSCSDGAFSLRLHRIFSVNGMYSNYRNLELLAIRVSESVFETKIYFNSAGLGLYVSDVDAIKNMLLELDGYGKSIFWDF